MSEHMATTGPTQSTATSTRIDAAHPVRDDVLAREDNESPDRTDSQTRQVVDSIAATDPHQLSDQVSWQASELASHLQSQQSTLDHREAEYNSRAARIENELRMARMLMREREDALADRERVLGQTLQQVEQISEHAALPDSTVDLPGARTKEGSTRPTMSVDGRTSRDRLLDENDVVLGEQRSELPEHRPSLEGERAALENRTRADRQRVEQAKRNVLATAEKKEAALEQRQNAIEKRHAAVEHLYSEVVRMHRESLEMRLCTQQLWAELSGTASQPEMTQKLSRLRRGLADHFQLASDALARQKEEHQELLARLGEQQKRIQTQRSELQRWVTRRQTELEEEAARLIARQQQLDGQESEISRLREQWDAQRREYQEEIRRLMSKLREAAAGHAA